MNHASPSEGIPVPSPCIPAFFESFPDALVIWSGAQWPVFANRAARELFDCDLDGFAHEILTNPATLFGPEAALRLPDLLREENATGFTAVTLPIPRKNGQPVIAEFRSMLMRIDGGVFRCLIIRDLAAAPSVPLSSAVPASPGFPVIGAEMFEEQELEFEMGADGFLTSMNEAALLKTRYTHHDVRRGLHFTALVGPDDRDRAYGDFDRLRRTPRLDALEYTSLRADGETFPIILSLSRISGPGESFRVRGTAFDISEHKKIEHDLLTREKLNALGELTSGVVHNFNNILAVILGYLALIPEEKVEDTFRKTLRGIRKAATDGADMVKRIQNFSRQESAASSETADLNGIIRDVLDYLAPRWIGAVPEIRVISRLGEIPPVSVVPFEMREVLSNIVINALDAMPGGGEITVTTHVEDNEAHVSVADTGTGMSEETKRRLFEPFFTTKKEKGTGIGLSVSRAIVLKFNGGIRVTSREGEGTTVTISLPAAPKQEFIGTGVPSPLPGARRILVLDDEENICEILREFLSRDGHDVVTAHRGERGLELLREHPFDIIITDLNMPGVSGWDLARRVRHEAPDTLIVMLTGWGSQVEQLNRHEHIVHHILHKPIDFALLNRIISETKRN